MVGSGVYQVQTLMSCKDNCVISMSHFAPRPQQLPQGMRADVISSTSRSQETVHLDLQLMAQTFTCSTRALRIVRDREHRGYGGDDGRLVACSQKGNTRQAAEYNGQCLPMKFIPSKTYKPKSTNNQDGPNLILTRIENLAADIATLDASDAFETPHAAVAVAISKGWMNTYALFSPSFSTCVLS